MSKYLSSSLLLAFLILGLSIIPESGAITQFYFTIPDEIQDTSGLIFSVDINNRNFSWVYDETGIRPFDNNASNTQANDSGMDLDANEYLLAIDENVDIGTRVYMCIFTPTYLEESLCQTDAIDKNNLARVNFDVLG
jgi:hypothetical protein